MCYVLYHMSLMGTGGLTQFCVILKFTAAQICAGDQWLRSRVSIWWTRCGY